MTIDRRTFLNASAAVAGGVVAGRGSLSKLAETRLATEGQSATTATSPLPFALATAGSSLAASVTSTRDTVLVATRSGERLWAHDGGFPGPFLVACGGEVMEVTGITGDLSPQLFSVVRSVNSVVSAHVAGTAVQLTVVETL